MSVMKFQKGFFFIFSVLGIDHVPNTVHCTCSVFETECLANQKNKPVKTLHYNMWIHLFYL